MLPSNENARQHVLIIYDQLDLTLQSTPNHQVSGGEIMSNKERAERKVVIQRVKGSNEVGECRYSRESLGQLEERLGLQIFDISSTALPLSYPVRTFALSSARPAAFARALTASSSLVIFSPLRSREIPVAVPSKLISAF